MIWVLCSSFEQSVFGEYCWNHLENPLDYCIPAIYRNRSMHRFLHIWEYKLKPKLCAYSNKSFDQRKWNAELCQLNSVRFFCLQQSQRNQEKFGTQKDINHVSVILFVCTLMARQTASLLEKTSLEKQNK